MNNVIDNCGGLRRWFEVSPPPPPRSSRWRAPRAPLPYLSRAILEDLENYRIYVTGGMPEEGGGRLRRTETPDIVETTDFVETDAEPVNQLVPEDAATKKKSRRRCCATLTATRSRPG